MTTRIPGSTLLLSSPVLALAGAFVLLYGCATTGTEGDAAADVAAGIGAEAQNQDSGNSDSVMSEAAAETDSAAAETGSIEAGDEALADGAAGMDLQESDEVAEATMKTAPTGDVVWIQRRLRDLGYYSGPVDGDAGGATRRAIRDYQTDQGLAPTGKPTPELQDFMWRNGG
jgi:peptidoglycan hydrolase-like protein with peptidoglycan-binding domain